MAYLAIIRQVFAIIFIAMGGYVVVYNWASVVQSHRTGRFHSAVPLIGAVFLGAGLAMLLRTRSYALLSILVDYGTLILLYSSPKLVRQFWETSRFNLLAEYKAAAGAVTTQISLYRTGKFVILHERQWIPGETGWVSLSNVGEWKQTSQHLTLTSGDKTAEFAPDVKDGVEYLRQISGSLWEDNTELSSAGMAFMRRA